MNKFIIGLAGLAALAAFPANAATLVFSENFENGLGVFSDTSGAVGTPSGQDYVNLAGSGFTGTGNSLTNNFVAFAAGNSAAFGRISTTFNTVLGTLYTINFDYGAIGNPGNEPQSLFYTANGGGIDELNFSPLPTTNNLNTLFKRAQSQFTGNGSPVTISFRGVGAANDNADVLLDNVSVRSGAVPETSTWAMMILGLGTVGGVMRRARRSSERGAFAAA